MSCQEFRDFLQGISFSTPAAIPTQVMVAAVTQMMLKRGVVRSQRWERGVVCVLEIMQCMISVHWFPIKTSPELQLICCVVVKFQQSDGLDLSSACGFMLSVWFDPLTLSCMRGLRGDPVVKALTSNPGGAGSVPGQGAKIPPASWPTS